MLGSYKQGVMVCCESAAELCRALGVRHAVLKVRGKQGGKCSCDLSLPCFIPDSCLGMVSAPYNKVERLEQFWPVLSFTIVLFLERELFDPFITQGCTKGGVPGFALLAQHFKILPKVLISLFCTRIFDGKKFLY